MAKRPPPPPPEPEMTPDHIRRSIARFRRRLDDLAKFDPDSMSDRRDPKIDALEVAITEALAEAFGRDTPRYQNYAAASRLDTAGFNVAFGTPAHEVIAGLHRGKATATGLLNQAISSLQEKLDELVEPSSDPAAKALRAYEGMDLHSVIARAASQLYRDGHYANAVEDSVKALNNLVRLHSGHEGDGTTLMETVFSPKKPILRFNDLKDESDFNEQKGFMMMFSGAVAGLRNPRAHRLITDDPERALEFIAFVSLLAKLLDGAKK
jgi:uncharacterized protein (TIGR02391 family)